MSGDRRAGHRRGAAGARRAAPAGHPAPGRPHRAARRADRGGVRRHPHRRQPAPQRAEERRAAPRAPRRNPAALPGPAGGPRRAAGLPRPDVGHVPAAPPPASSRPNGGSSTMTKPPDEHRTRRPARAPPEHDVGADPAPLPRPPAHHHEDPMAAPRDHTPLRRPPIRQATMVRSDVEHTFTVFVREIGAWWPTPTISAGGEQVRTVTVEPRPRWARLRDVARRHDRRVGTVARLGPAPPLHDDVAVHAGAHGGRADLHPAGTRAHPRRRRAPRLGGAQRGPAPRRLRPARGLCRGPFATGWTRILAALTRAAETEEPA